MKKLILKTDFFDYYDIWFDRKYDMLNNNYEVFERYQNSGMNRKEMLTFLDQCNVFVPEHGIVREMNFDLKDFVVVYLDLNSHRGKDKILCSFNHAKNFYPVNYMSRYINSNDDYSDPVSYRALRIGYKNFYLKYKSDHFWMSNYGDVDIEILNKPFVNINNIMKHKPLLAIDFVKKNNDYYAVDLNISPGLTWTGIEDVLSGKEVFEEIKKYYFDNQKI